MYDDFNSFEEYKKHILLHLQSIRKSLDTKNYAQVEFDMYEIAQHLNFSPAEVNNDRR